MRRIAISLLLLTTTVIPAFAFDTPRALIEALYAPYSKGDDFDWSTWDESVLRSKALNTLFDADAREAGDDMGRLDFDPYVDGQDYQLSDLKIGDAAITGDTAEVEVTFKNLDSAEDLRYTLVQEADGWKIDDVSSDNKDFPYSLKAIMSAPLPK